MAAFLTICSDCFFVPTNKMVPPWAARFRANSMALARLFLVFSKSKMWMPERVAKIYGFILGFHLEAECPKCAPLLSSSKRLISFIYYLSCPSASWRRDHFHSRNPD